MKTAIRLIIIAILFAACIRSESLAANFSVPSVDGWYTWQVEAADGGELQVYTKVESGEPVRFRVRSNSVCFANLEVEAHDLGAVKADQSVSWLQRYILPVTDISSEVILVISLHAGDLPVEILNRLLSGNS
jgi:hypothetical protein